MPEPSPENREHLLVQLFELMEKSARINALEADHKERIKEKYRKASDEQIVKGIQMLKGDIAEKELEEAKLKQKLEKNLDTRKKISLQAKTEKIEAEKHAENILKELETFDSRNSGKHHKQTSRLYLLPLVIVIAAIILFLYLK